MATVQESGEERAPVPAWQAWTETVAITALFPLAGLAANPSDPLFLEAKFCWPLFAPMVAGLRYGFRHGVLCAAGLVGAMELVEPAHLSSSLVVASLLVAMVGGSFASTWERRVIAAELLASSRARRSEAFVRTFHAMKESHARLERRMRIEGGTLRSALGELRRRLLEPSGGAPVEELILRVFADHAGLVGASFHRVGGGEALVASAALGEPPDPRDPLLFEAIARRKTMTVRDGMQAETVLIAAVPLVDVTGRLHGVLAVRSLPFLRLHDGTLRLLSILGGHVADQLAAFPQGSNESSERLFRTALTRALEDLQAYRLPASLVRVTVPASEEKALVEMLAAERRLLDPVWVRSDGVVAEALILLGITGLPGARAAVARMRRGVVDRLQERAVVVVARERELVAGEDAEALVAPWPEPEGADARGGVDGLG